MQKSNFDSVSSVFGGIFLDTGVLGLVIMIYIGLVAWLSCGESPYPSVLRLFFLVWFAAYAVATSYWQLSSPWAALGFILQGGCFLRERAAAARSEASGTPLSTLRFQE